MDINVASDGAVTCRREGLEHGLEPDDSYWIQNEPTVRGRLDIDLEEDPSPDLAIEIEVSRSTMDRMAIYAAMWFPEVWCWDGKSLRIFLLNSRATYRQSDHSRAFPFLPLAEFAEFIAPTDTGETQLLRS